MSQTNLQPNKKWDDMSLMERVRWYQEAAFFPAFTVMIFLRRKIGFRKFNPLLLLVMSAILFVLPLAVASNNSNRLDLAMLLYVVAMFGYAHFCRWQRWGEILRGERWHTYSRGISYFEKLPLPEFMFKARRIYRFLDPLAAFLIGLLLAKCGAKVLGGWIAFAAFCLLVSEELLFEKILNHQLDIMDGMVDSEVQQEIVQHFQQPQPEQKQLQLEDTAGIPTGLCPELSAQIELRKARRAQAQQQKAAAENAAPNKPENPAVDTVPPKQAPQ